MAESIWTDDMSFGLPELDASHQDLLDELAQLSAATPEKFGAHFSVLLEKIEYDFSNEEQRMEEIDFPGLKNHREQHAKLLGVLHNAAPQIMNGDIALGQEVIRQLPNWFIHHLATMDAALAQAIKEMVPIQ